MTQPQLMRQIAEAIECNPDGWWREFERQIYVGYCQQKWVECCSQFVFFNELKGDNIRPKPRTYTLHVQEMPEPLREEPGFGSVYFLLCLRSGEITEIHWQGAPIERRWLSAGLCYPDEPTAREALEKLTKAMGGE